MDTQDHELRKFYNENIIDKYNERNDSKKWETKLEERKNKIKKANEELNKLPWPQ